jgi:serine/threonine protein kinase/Tfp pilus assembly protein PilF
MSKTSLFDIGPERLNRLLSIGREKLDADNDSKSESSKLTSGETIPAEKPGSWIGRYKLIRMIGEGGMGEVYLAEQEHPIKRRVALKVIKPGMDSKRVIARFEAERQALALLDYPNIAHVYDAGTTETGRLYFVMEYVKGLPITEYCDHYKLTIKERLRLFQQVCHAVHHAHQKGIIHRDIKPSNILVSLQDDQAVPKIIDFGVAKAVSKPLTERTLITEVSQLLGTPEYMSPEQADMATEDIDTRSDIYSLGVLLYELLTGVLPFDSDTLRTGGIERIRRVIRETDPKTPSTRLAKLGEKASEIAQNRQMEIQTLAKHLRKELECIPLKAMRKERAERYRSASEFADDIDNYLNGVPLLAGPPSTRYRLKKFARRNRVVVAGGTGLVLVLVAGVVVSTLFAIRAERARSQAQEVSDYLLTYVLDSRNDGKLLDRDFEKMLDNAVEGLEGKFEDQPLVEAGIRYTLAQKYLEALNPEPAKVLLERAYQIRVQQFGPEDQSALQFAMMLGWAYCILGQYDVATQMWTNQIETLQRVYGDRYWRIRTLMVSIGSAYTLWGKYDKAEACLDEALQRWQSFGILRRRGQNYLAQGRYAEAEQSLSKALELERPPGVQRFSCMMTLSIAYREQGRYKEAQQLCETTLKAAREELGEDHWITLYTECELGRILMDEGLLTEAEKLISEALRIRRLKRSVGDNNAFPFINALAVVLTRQGKYADANDLFAEALEGRKQILGESHPETLETLKDFGVLRREQKNYPEAEELLRQALEGRQHTLGNDHPDCFESMHELGVLYKAQARYDEAEKYLLDAVEGRRLKLGDKHPDTIVSLKALIALYETWNKPEKAKHWRAKLP